MTNYAGQWNPNGPYGIVKANEVEGGIQVFAWAIGSYADVYEALDDKVPAGRRVKGMVVRMVSDVAGDMYTDYTWNGSAWVTLSNLAAQYGFGVIAGMTLSASGFPGFDVAAGQLVDWDGKVFTLDNAATFNAAVTPGTYVVHADATNGISWTLLSTGLAWGKVPLAIVTTNGTIFTYIEQCQYMANGTKSKTAVSVGTNTGLSGANFASARAAMMWLGCFVGSEEAPNIIHVVSNITEQFSPNVGTPYCISLTESAFAQASSRLQNLQFVGVPNSTSSIPCKITIGATGREGGFLDGNLALHGLKIQNLQFAYAGDVNAANHDITVINDLGKGTHIADVIIAAGGAKFTHFASWISTSGALYLGGVDLGTYVQGTTFERVHLDNPVASNAIIYIQESVGLINGLLTLRDCSFIKGTGGFSALVDTDDQYYGINLFINVDGCFVQGCSGTVFQLQRLTKLQVINTRFWNATASTYTDVSGTSNAHFANCIYFNQFNSIGLGGQYYVNCASARPEGLVSAIANNGSGFARITSANHMLANGLKVAIDVNDNDYDGEYVIYNVTANTFDIPTAYTVSRTGSWWAQRNPVTGNSTAQFVNCKFQTTSAAGDAVRIHSGLEVIEPSSELVNYKNAYVAISAFRSLMYEGTYATRGTPNVEIQIYPGIDSGAAVIEMPASMGVLCFPDGVSATVFAPLSTLINIETTDDLRTSAPAADYVVIYVFLRKKRRSFPEVDNVVYSSSSPQTSGALKSGEEESGYAATDYLFVGSLMTGNVSGSTGSAGKWDMCRVTHHNNGMRQVWVSAGNSFYLPSNMKAQALSDAASSATGTMSMDLNAALPTAVAFETRMDANLMGGGTNPTPINISAQIVTPAGSHALNLRTQRAMTAGTDYDSAEQLVTVPRMNGATDYPFAWAVTGAHNANLNVNVHSWLENVRYPIPINPPRWDA